MQKSPSENRTRTPTYHWASTPKDTENRATNIGPKSQLTAGEMSYKAAKTCTNKSAPNLALPLGKHPKEEQKTHTKITPPKPTYFWVRTLKNHIEK